MTIASRSVGRAARSSISGRSDTSSSCAALRLEMRRGQRKQRVGLRAARLQRAAFDEARHRLVVRDRRVGRTEIETRVELLVGVKRNRARDGILRRLRQNALGEKAALARARDDRREVTARLHAALELVAHGLRVADEVMAAFLLRRRLQACRIALRIHADDHRAVLRERIGGLLVGRAPAAFLREQHDEAAHLADGLRQRDLAITAAGNRCSMRRGQQCERNRRDFQQKFHERQPPASNERSARVKNTPTEPDAAR